MSNWDAKRSKQAFSEQAIEGVALNRRRSTDSQSEQKSPRACVRPDVPDTSAPAARVRSGRCRPFEKSLVKLHKFSSHHSALIFGGSSAFEESFWILRPSRCACSIQFQSSHN